MLILILEDEARIRAGIGEMLLDEGYQVLEAATLQQGLDLLERESPDAVLSDIHLPDGDGFSILECCQHQYPDISVIFMTAFGNRELAIQAIRQGAYDYIAKPVRFDELFARLYRLKEMQTLKGQVQRKASRKQEESQLAILGSSEPMKRVRNIAEKAMESDAPILITGETGVGKGLLAKLIHTSSRRKEKPFIGINCASIPENLLESELFGFRKGAFTGADRNKKGLLEEVGDGTLFLDEIGEMPLQLQAKLLHVLDDGAFRPLGGTKSLRFKGRIIAATNVDPQHLIDGKDFRADLYYRLSVLTIDIPPLRDRPEDILPLAERLYHELALDMGKHQTDLPMVLARQLQQQAWPGNVRQLRNYLERALILDGEWNEDTQKDELTLAVALQQFERSWILKTLADCHGDKVQAAQRLGIGLSTLYRKLDG